MSNQESHTVDRSRENVAPSTGSPLAQPMLASTIYALREETRQRQPPLPRLSTGCRSIDVDCLGDGTDRAARRPYGLKYGEGGIVGLACENGSATNRDHMPRDGMSARNRPYNNAVQGDVDDVADVLQTTLLARHLLTCEDESEIIEEERIQAKLSHFSTASVIDTADAFSPAMLYRYLRYHLTIKSRHLISQKRISKLHDALEFGEPINIDEEDYNEVPAQHSLSAEDIEQLTRHCLDRVDIIRVLDFEGLFEALAEIRAKLDSSDPSRLQFVSNSHVTENDPDLESAHQNSACDSPSKGRNIEEPEPKRRRVEIPSSQSPSPSPSPPPLHVLGITTAAAGTTSTRAPTHAEAHGDHATQNNVTKKHVNSAKLHLVLITKLPNVLSPLMHKNHVRGHALLASLLRQMRSLTQLHNVCIIIGNAVVEGEASSLMHRSVFAHNGNKRPASGRLLDWGLDLSLMVTLIDFRQIRSNSDTDPPDEDNHNSSSIVTQGKEGTGTKLHKQQSAHTVFKDVHKALYAIEVVRNVNGPPDQWGLFTLAPANFSPANAQATWMATEPGSVGVGVTALRDISAANH